MDSLKPSSMSRICLEDRRVEERVLNMASAAATTSTVIDKLPITLITGFLGSGKTTLMNRILSENHGKKFAVIENEFGEVGIDDELIKQKVQLEGVDEENFCMELNNGCICCTVRADVSKIIRQFIEKHKVTPLDGVLIETTGVADPAPVIQTLFADASISGEIFLDGVLTVVDAKHIESHVDLKGGSEAVNQVAYADRILLNKVDLVTAAELEEVEDRILAINSTATIIQCVHANVPMSALLGIHAFEIDRAMGLDPTLMDEDDHGHSHGHEHTGDDCTHSSHDHGHAHEEEGEAHSSHDHDEHEHTGDDCTHSSHDHGHAHEEEGEAHGHDHHGHDGEAAKVDAGTDGGHDHGHGHAEESAKTKPAHGHGAHGKKKEHKVKKHHHDSLVKSVSVMKKGEVDYEVLMHWLSDLLRERGDSIYRSKAILNVKDETDVFVVQGVHQVRSYFLRSPPPARCSLSCSLALSSLSLFLPARVSPPRPPSIAPRPASPPRSCSVC
jgi:G3E family GTPase